MELKDLENKILESFFPEGKQLTINKIMKRVGCSYERANTSLKKIKNLKILTEDKIGKTLVYTPDFSSQFIKMAYSNYQMKRVMTFSQKHLKLYNALNSLSGGSANMVLIFGSCARGTNSKLSDVDVLATSHKKTDIENKILSLEYVTGVEFSPISMPILEFPKIKKENLELWSELKRDAIVIQNPGWFYYHIYENEN